MAAFHNALSYLRSLCGSAWMLSHHVGHPAIMRRRHSARGSTDIQNYADAAMTSTRRPLGFEVVHDKHRWGMPVPPRLVTLHGEPPDDPVTLAWNPTDAKDDAGVVECARWLAEEWLADREEHARQDTLKAAHESGWSASTLDRAVGDLHTARTIDKSRHGKEVAYRLAVESEEK